MLAKGRSRRNREAKKPKGGKKSVLAVTTFLRPQPADARPTTKESGK